MEVVIDGVAYFPAAAVAEELSTTETRILMLLRQKELSGVIIEGSWYVTAESLSSYVPKEDRQLQGCRTTCTASSCSCG